MSKTSLKTAATITTDGTASPTAREPEHEPGCAMDHDNDSGHGTTHTAPTARRRGNAKLPTDVVIDGVPESPMTDLTATPMSSTTPPSVTSRTRRSPRTALAPDGARAKASNGSGGVYPRTLTDGSTVYDVRWSYRDGERKLKRGVKKGFATKGEADRFRRRVTAEVDNRTFVAPTRLTLGEQMTTYLQHSRHKPQTLSGYERLARLHITPHLGHLLLADITPAQLNRLYRRLETEGSPGGDGPLSLTSVRHVHNLISGCLTAAVREGLLAVSPAARAKPPTLREAKEQREDYVVWSADELAHFLHVAHDDHYFPLWRVLAATGMRRGEALGLHWADVDLEHGTLALRRSLGEDRRGGRRVPVLGSLKGGRAHVIAIDKETVHALRLQRAQQETDRLHLGERWVPSGHVFTRGRLWLRQGQVAGGPLDGDRVTEAFNRDVARAGVPRIRLHDLRHTWASLALASGKVDIKVVSERLGHASTGITWDTYSHVRPGMDRDAAAIVAAMFTIRPETT